MNFLELKKYFILNLKNFYKSNEIEVFLKLILEDLWNIKTIDIISKEIIFDKLKIDKIDEILNQLKQYKPIQYVLGRTFFYNSFIEVNENVLIPRPETEELVELILKENNLVNAFIIDICTGSGCIAVSIAKERNWNVFATDISPMAIEIAQKNAKSNNVSVEFKEFDFLNQINWIAFDEKKFDIIVSNPPYVLESEKKQMEKNVLNYEPHLALFVEDKEPLIFYEAIAKFAYNYLNINGIIYVEINEKFGKQTADIFKNSGFTNVEVLKDFRQKDRFVRAKF